MRLYMRAHAACCWRLWSGAAGLLLTMSLASVAIGGAKGAEDQPKSKVASRQTPVPQAFGVALEAFGAGNYPESSRLCQVILQKTPSFEPAIHLMGRSLYRMGRPAEAFPWLARLNPTLFDAETSFEFGMSAMTVGQWGPCFDALARVPDGQTVSDLARFYGATCAMRLKRYAEAEDMLERAAVLPDKLAKLRALYLKHLEETRLETEKQALAREREELAGRKGKDAKKPAATAAAPVVDKGYAHQGYMGVQRWARGGHTQKSQLTDFSGTSQKTATSDTTYFKFLHGPLMPLPYKADEKRQAAVGAQVFLNFSDRINDGKMRRFVVEDSASEAIRVETTPTGRSHFFALEVSGAPWVEVPLPSGWWLAVQGDLYYNYPKFERGLRGGYRAGGSTLFRQAGPVGVATTVTITENFNSTDEAVSHQTRAQVVGSGDILPELSAEVTTQFDRFTYVDANAGGPDASYAALGKLVWKLPVGVSLEAKGSVERQTNNIVRGLGDWGDVSADGNLYMGKLKLGWKPFGWVSVSAAQTLQRSEWTVSSNSEAQDTYDLNNPNYVSVQELDAGINVAF